MTHLLSNEVAADLLENLLYPGDDRAGLPRQLSETKAYLPFQENVALAGVLFGFGWMIFVPWMTRHYNFHHPRRRQPACFQFLQSHKRSFEQFASGTRDEAPPPPSGNFQTLYRGDRFYLYSVLFRTSLMKAHLLIVFCGTLALMLSWWVRNAEAVADRARGYFGPADAVRLSLEMIARAQQIVLYLASVLLSLYVIYRIWRMHQAMDMAWRLQGRIHDIAILLGALLAPYRPEPGVREVLYTVHRHLNLVHFLAYSEACSDVNYAAENIDIVVESGLLFDDECELLCPELDARITSVFSWLSASIDRLVEVQLISQAYAPVVLEAVGELLHAAQNLMEQGRQKSRPILATAHMVSILGDTVTLLTPAALVHLFKSEDNTTVYFWAMFGSMLVAMFYQGVCKLAKALQNPFEEELDGLNVSWALMSTERKVFACLAGHDGTGTFTEDYWAVTPANLTQLAKAAAASEKVGPGYKSNKRKDDLRPLTRIADLYHPKCPQGHESKLFVTEHDGWVCDVCGNEFLAGTHLFACHECEWDSCQTCGAEQKAVAAKPVKQADLYRPRCPQGHTSKLFITETDGWACDVCGNEYLAGTHMFGCQECEWDICQNCSTKQQDAVARGQYVTPPQFVTKRPSAPPSEAGRSWLDESEFDAHEEMPPSEASVRGESYWDVGSEAGSIALSEGGPVSRSSAPRRASDMYFSGKPLGPESLKNQPLGIASTAPPPGGLQPVVYNPQAVGVTLSRDLIQATYSALREPREIILDDASLDRLETITTRPITELAAALIEVNDGGRTGKFSSGASAVSGPLPTLAEEDEGAPPDGRAPPEPAPANAAQVTQGERVMLDLIGQYHSELQSGSDLRSQAAVVGAGGTARTPGMQQAAVGGAGGPARAPAMQQPAVVSAGGNARAPAMQSAPTAQPPSKAGAGDEMPV